MHDLSPDDFMNVRSYHDLVDYVYSDENQKSGAEPPSGVVFCHLDNIHEFFAKFRTNKYVLVSAESDFGLTLQSYRHPNQDLHKLLGYVDFAKLSATRENYVQLSIGPACREENCLLSDVFSVKCNTFTNSTFPNIPENVAHWFVSNCELKEEGKLERIPFGLADNKNNNLLKRLSNEPKRKLLYVNFQPYTTERIHLRNHYSRQGWATYVNDPVSKEQYLEQMADHQFVLCPAGNGLDCYRTYEVLYSGAWPVMERTPFTAQFSNLPVVYVNNLLEVTPQMLVAARRKIIDEWTSYDWKFVQLSYWKQRFAAERAKILSV